MSNNVIHLNERKNSASVAINDQDGNPWFLAENVCDELGIDMSQLMEMVGQEQTALVNDMPIISEKGFYSAIYFTNTSGAKRWQDYLINEVLPQFQATGKIPVPDEKMYSKLTKAPSGMSAA